MKNYFLVLSLLMFIAPAAGAQSLDARQLERLDDRFRSLLADTVPALGLKASGPVPDQLEVENIVGKVAEPLYGAAIYTDDVDALRKAGIEVNSEFADFATARLSVADLLTVARMDGIRYVDAGETLYPHNDVAVAVTGAHLLQAGKVNSTTYDGTNVIVCVIDTGIDWDHADFTDDGSPSTSRILYIWDQTLTKTGSEGTPDEGHPGDADYDGFTYGVEYTQAHINEDLDGAADGLTVRQTDTDGHGTHVAGTAAGDGTAEAGSQYKGMAPNADLVVVKAGNGSFSFTNVVNGLNYCGAVAADAGKPVVVNMSLGTDEGPHDGTRSQDTAIDSFIGAGKVAVVSAGNSGGDNLHKTATIADAATGSISLVVPAYTGGAGDDISIDIWFTDQVGTVTAKVTGPGAQTATQAAGSSSTGTTDGEIYISNTLDGTNGDRHVEIEIDDGAGTDPAVGTWTIDLTNSSGGSLTYHAWFYDRSIGSSSATMTGGDDNYIVGSPGMSTGALTVGAFVARSDWCNKDDSCYSGSATLSDDLASFSSLGPRPDAGAAQKPDIAGPGQHMISSWSSDMSPAPSDSRKANAASHRVTQGTSMSSPAVAGGIALLLDETSTLTATQIRTLIRDSADFDSFTSTVPNDSWGYGKFNVYQAMIRHLGGTPGAHEILTYDTWTASGGQGLAATQKAAVRFTPTVSGTVTGLFFHTSGAVTVTTLNAEIWSNSSSLPSAKLGSSVTVTPATIGDNSWTYVDMSGAGVNVVAGTDYHAVLDFAAGTTFAVDGDTGTIDNRSSVDAGGGTFAAHGLRDFRIRPLVTNNAAVTTIGTASTANDVGWRMFAPPSTGMTRASLAGITFSSTSGAGDDLVQRYDESGGVGDARWLDTASGASLPQGQGFIAYYFDDVTDPVSPNLTLSWAGATESTLDFTTAALDTNEEFHLLGNPFFTTFDLSELNLGAQGFQTTVQVWNPSTSSYSNVVQAVGTTDLIAMGQGFFAQRSSTSVGTTTVIYDADGRTKAGTLVGKTSTAAEPGIGFWLTVTNPNGKLIAFDEAANVVFREGATSTWDPFDASKLKPLVPAYATASIVGSRRGEVELLSQAAYPLKLAESIEIPLEISAVGLSGHAQLEWSRLETLPAHWRVELLDVQTGAVNDLRRTNGYQFPLIGNASAAKSAHDALKGPLKMGSTGDARFLLVVSPVSSTGLNDLAIPTAHALEQNYPNPFTETSTIRFAIPKAGSIRLTVFDVLGREVAVLVDDVLAAGWHEAGFDAAGLSAGLYLYRLETAGGSLTRPMQLVR
jgi:subtilisin family serine protease